MQYFFLFLFLKTEFGKPPTSVLPFGHLLQFHAALCNSAGDLLYENHAGKRWNQ